MEMDYLRKRQEIIKEKHRRFLTNKDISEQTGADIQLIEDYLCGKSENKEIEVAILKEFGMLEVQKR